MILSCSFCSEAFLIGYSEASEGNIDTSQNNPIISNPPSNGTKKISLHPICGIAEESDNICSAKYKETIQRSKRNQREHSMKLPSQEQSWIFLVTGT